MNYLIRMGERETECHQEEASDISRKNDKTKKNMKIREISFGL
jgi:hypothetical protein